MDANLNFLTAPVSNPTSVGASSSSGGLDPNLAKPMNGQEFAGVMRDLMAKGERQEIAGTAPIEKTIDPSTALQTLNLGNQFSVITAATPLPDPNSLAKFARAQGLSESAVLALFGDLTDTSSSKTQGFATESAVNEANSASDLSQAGIPNLGLLGFPVNPLLSAQTVTPSTNSLLNSQALKSNTNTLLSSLPFAPSAANVSTITLLPNSTPMGWIQVQPNALTVSDQVVNAALVQAPQNSAESSKVSELNALMQTAGATGVLQALGGTGAAPSKALGSVDNLADLQAEMGPLDAMRMRMVPSWENTTRQLSQMSGTEQAAAWGQLTANLFNSKSKGGDVKEVSLDLGIDDPDLIAALDGMRDDTGNSFINVDSGRNIASTGSLGAAATGAVIANPQMTDRAAQIQDMADKLGKAMAERLQDQLANGEWKLQLKLNPAHLGKIDVQLDMSSSGLDAVFKTDNLVTRELIAQGMPKLKDTLAESGMTVANVWVNSENQRGSGGNSTPRQQATADNSSSAPVKEVLATEPRVKDLRSSNAWDTLA